jgi:hypothetical protein
MFNVSNNNPFIDFKFQRSTNTTSIIKALGREPSEEEIEKAKQNSFSVDNVFCSNCEKKFTEIENKFINETLPKLRGKDFSFIQKIHFNETISIRRFFLLQVFRTSICNNLIKVSKEFREVIRDVLIESKSEEIKSIPLFVTYLNTLGDKIEFTKNVVGFGNIEGNGVIFLNDFIIQFFQDEKSIQYIDLYGLNSRTDFENYINFKEQNFLIKIVSNVDRNTFSETYFKTEKAKSLLESYRGMFRSAHVEFLHSTPSEQIVESFIKELVNDKNCTEETRYSSDNIAKCMLDFFIEKLNFRIPNS